MPKSLARSRETAFARQRGRCFYCNLPMWSRDPGEYALKYNLTSRQANRLQCTGEHLVARQDGGSNSPFNIVAACRFCNANRHRRAAPPSPDVYKQLIGRRLSQGRWHDPWIVTRVMDELNSA
jgi:5-methylcytosine-specific restriction endonuclease McrA